MARLKPCPDEAWRARAGESARKEGRCARGFVYGALKVRPTKIRVKSVPPFRKRRDGASGGSRDGGVGPGEPAGTPKQRAGKAARKVRDSLTPLMARLKPCPDDEHNARAGESARKVSVASSVLFMAHLKVRPTKIGVNGMSTLHKAKGSGHASGSGDFGVGGCGDWFDFLD